MSLKLGYLVPTREQVMRGNSSAAPLIDAAKFAADLGADSLWVGDSLTARPRHDPITLLAGLATAIPRVELGTAVLLPALKNPVVLAQQLATIDQLAEGRLIVGAGIAADTPTVHAEFAAAGVPFEKRVGRLLEGVALMRALWKGDPVDWDGRWKLSQQSVAPEPFRKGGPPIWLGTSTDAGLRRIAKHFDGWFPIGPNLATFSEKHKTLKELCASKPVSTALYATVAVMEDEAAAEQAINDYLHSYYNVPPDAMRSIQACCGGPIDKVIKFLRGYADAGAEHIVLRIVGDPKTTLPAILQARAELAT